MGRQLGRWHLDCCFMHLTLSACPLRLLRLQLSLRPTYCPRFRPPAAVMLLGAQAESPSLGHAALACTQAHPAAAAAAATTRHTSTALALISATLACHGLLPGLVLQVGSC